MSANAEVFQSSELVASRVQETPQPQPGRVCDAGDWNPEAFAREQIRGLVQRVFFASGSPQVRQVVFSAVGPNADVADICEQVGQALALETHGHIAIVGRDHHAAELVLPHPLHAGNTGIKGWSTQLSINLWRVPGFARREFGEKSGTGAFWNSRFAELRSEFEYAVIHAPSAETSIEAALLGQLADGIILVLGAHSTRKATARKIKQTLEGTRSRILGTVLSERRFPVPERIYRIL